MTQRLVIQLARMGDVVQSLPLLERIRRHHPDDRITLLVDTPLVPLFERISGVDQVYGFPMEECWNTAKNSDWLPQFAWWRTLLRPMLEENFDQIFVLNYSHLAVTLSDLFQSSDRIGYRSAQDRKTILRSLPLNLLFATVQHRPRARWHLADIYAALVSNDSPNLGNSHMLPGNLIQWQLPQNKLIDSSEKKVGIIIGAGDPKRMLTIEFYVELIHQLLTSNDVSVVLYGGTSEKDRQDQILSSLDTGDRQRVKASAGGILLKELPEYLMDCDLVVGPDTGPLHIAAWCNVPTLGLYFSSASVHQTGPYGRNCWVLDSNVPCRVCKEEDPCQRYDCRNQFTPHIVSTTIRWILECVKNSSNNQKDIPHDLAKNDPHLRVAKFDDWGITYPKHPILDFDTDNAWQRELFGRLLFPETRAPLLAFPAEIKDGLLEKCQNDSLVIQNAPYAILSNFLEFEDQHNRRETRSKVQEMLSRNTVPPKWSIIIPVYNQCHLTRKCLESILKTTDFRDMEILVMDNGSTDDTASVIDNLQGPIRRIDMGENKGFASACNQGAKEAQGQWLFFLNNDIEVQPDWFESLDAAASKYGDSTILGAKLLYPDGRIQHAGVAFDDRGMPVHVGKGCSSEDPRWTKDQYYPAVTAAAMAISKSRFLEMGGFDESYLNGYEDVDFCLRAVENGMKAMVIPGVQIYHYQGSTPGRYRHDADNERRFLDKWSARIQQHPEWNMNNYEHAKHRTPEITEAPNSRREFAKPSRHFLVITGEPLHYPSPILRLISPLNALKDKRFLDFSMLPLHNDPSAFREAMQTFAKIDGVIVQRLLPQNWMTEEILQLIDRTGIPLIVETDDLVAGRHAPASTRALRESEHDRLFLEMIRHSTVVTVSTKVLKNLLLEWLDSTGQSDPVSEPIRIEVLPNLLDPKIWNLDSQMPKTANGKVRMGFFGSETHSLDLAMITPAVRMVLSEFPNEVELCCWGCITEELKTEDGVRFMGPYNPNYPQYAKWLQDAKVDFALVPLISNRFNRAKSPIKYLELGISGIPGIYSNLEPYHQVVHHEQSGIMAADNTWEWVEAMSKLIENHEYRTSLAMSANQDVKEHYLLPQHLDKWEHVLGAL